LPSGSLFASLATGKCSEYELLLVHWAWFSELPAAFQNARKVANAIQNVGQSSQTNQSMMQSGLRSRFFVRVWIKIHLLFQALALALFVVGWHNDHP
jgi:hypothetical protein